MRLSHISLLRIARSEDELAHGLKFVRALPPMTGMLFDFASPRVLKFWMADTYVPLDIAFIDGNGIIVKTARMKPHDLSTTSSGKPCVMALEVKAGLLDSLGIKVGHSLSISKDGKGVIICDNP